MYKWRDEKWLQGNHYVRATAIRVATYIVLSQILLLAFDALVTLYYSVLVGVVLFFLHCSAIVNIAALVVWTRNDFHLPKKWGAVVVTIFVLFVVGGIMGSVLGSGIQAFLSFTASWCALFVVLAFVTFSDLYPKLRQGDVVISETVFPAYVWSKKNGGIAPYSKGLYGLYGAYAVVFTWGVGGCFFSHLFT